MSELLDILRGAFAPMISEVEKPRYDDLMILQFRPSEDGPVIYKTTIGKSVYSSDDLLENWINNQRSRFGETRDAEYKLPPKRS